ncbi:hypothetical protein GYB62_01220, partial [bacterium]|nr:hypothetical protein [bacterium]
MQEAKSGVIGNAVLTAFFVLFLFLPLIVGVLEKDKLASSSEKRSLATFPSFPQTIDQLIQYPSSLNAYYADHFGLREFFTQRYFRFMKKFSESSQVDHVTIGKDGWLFLGSAKPGYDKYEDPFGDAMHANLYSEEELKQFSEALVSINRRLAEQGVAYLFVLAPNKHTIYFEQMPEHIVKQNPYSAADQLFEYLTKHT